jgi:hypothetical protein
LEVQERVWNVKVKQTEKRKESKDMSEDNHFSCDLNCFVFKTILKSFDIERMDHNIDKTKHHVS